ncbi:MAG: YfiR family protein [Acidobacteria bacterium]|nr:YfiR family protein [Acidobacteriota bacterium]
MSAVRPGLAFEPPGRRDSAHPAGRFPNDALLDVGVARGAGQSEPAPGAQSDTPRPQVEAEYLLSVVSFTEWPADAMPGGAAVHFCVAGADVIFSALDSAARGDAILGRPLVVHRVGRPDEVVQCHAIFVSQGEDPRVEAFLGAAAGVPVLTMGESAAFARAGGMVSFGIEEGRVRFDLNRSAAEARGLRFRSQLLRLARRVT